MPLANVLKCELRCVADLKGKLIAILLPGEENTAWWEWPLKLRRAGKVGQLLEQWHSPLTLVDVLYTVGARGEVAPRE